MVAADSPSPHPPPPCAGSPRCCGPSSSAASFPFPWACRVGAPAPRPPTPPRLPSPAERAGRVSPGPRPQRRAGRAAGRGAGLRARIPLGSGTSCTAQGAGGRPGEGTALQLLRPPPFPPIPPQKKRNRGGEAHRCLHYIMSPPLPPGPRAPPGRGNRGAVRVARLEAAQLLHGGLGAGAAQPSLSPGAVGEKLLPQPPAGGKAMGRKGWPRSPDALAVE